MDLTLGNPIGAGGLADIFAAEHRILPGISRPVVVKKLKPEHRDDPELRLMLTDEARVLACLNHPNVVQLLDVIDLDGSPGLVFERVDGLSLRELMQESAAKGYPRLPVNAAATIMQAVAEALGYVHAATDSSGRHLAIVHRDLNPNNVMISRHGAVRLIDFGIARSEVRVYETATGTLKGTCGYMAPEQLDPSKPQDHRVDLFAFGVLFSETMFGHHPFVAKSHLELYDRISSGKREPLPESAGASGRLQQLADRCMQWDAAQRPADAWELAKELPGAYADAGIEAAMCHLAGLMHALEG
ncbi:MAG: serine/threonine-protein kinase [Polyangiaceae bacterium]